MGYYSITNLSCTNPKILSSGSTYNQNTNSEFLGIENGKSHYRTWKSNMHQEILELSELHPDETFTETWWWDENYLKRILWTGVYFNGKYKELKMEPGYVFIEPSKGIVDDNLVKRFSEHVMLYVERINLIEEDPEKGTKFNFLSHEMDGDGFCSHISITWENADHKFTAINKVGYMINIEYEKKEPMKNELEEIDNESGIGTNEDFIDFPF